jgi:DNA-directed RNA polymerase beta subunit
MAVYEADKSDESDEPVAEQAGDGVECAAAEDRAGVLIAKEASEHRILEVRDCRLRLIQKYHNFMKDLENQQHQEVIKLEKYSKMQCIYAVM